MDNLAAHKVAGVEEAIRATGASLLYLPPYSPDLNPIEQVFVKLKALLRGAATRTKEALWTTIGQLLNRFKSAECRNYLTNSGYKFRHRLDDRPRASCLHGGAHFMVEQRYGETIRDVGHREHVSAGRPTLEPWAESPEPFQHANSVLCSPATNVVVRQCSCGTAAIRRSLLGAQP